MESFDVRSYMDRLKALQESDDIEYSHVEADQVLCDLLEALGYEKIVAEYEKIEKWYA